MKNVFLIFVLCVLTLSSKAQTWQPLGPDNRDELGFGFTKLLWVKQYADTIYAALVFTAINNGKSLVAIKKFNGLKWDTVGTSLSVSSTYSSTSNLPTNLAITMDRTFTPYAIGSDYPNGYVVKKCVNGVWNQVGNAGFITGTPTSVSIKIGKTDTPYVLATLSNKISVWKFNGTAWDSVGNTQFATISGTPMLGLDTADVPYVAFSDPANLNRATVMNFTGNIWTTISPVGGLSTLGAGGFNIQIDSVQNILFLKYHDTALGATVKRYDGTSWTSVGSVGQMNNYAEDMCVNSVGIPYLSMRHGDSAWVMKYDGSNWVTITHSIKGVNITSLGLSQDSVPILGYHLASYGYKPVVGISSGSGWIKKGTYGLVSGGISKYTNNNFSTLPNYILTTVTSNNVPYIIFSDLAYSGKLSLMKYTNGNWSYEGIPGFTSSASYPIQFEKGKNDTLFLMYAQIGVSGYKIAYFDGSSFVDINSGLTNSTYPATTAFALDTAGIPYVIYPDPTNFNISTLKKWGYGAWAIAGSVPCTTAVQMKINKQNEVHVLYNSTVNNTTVSNLVKLTNNSWTTLIQSSLQGQLKIAPNDSVYLFTKELKSMTVGVGYGSIIYYWHERRLYTSALNNWSSSGLFYITNQSAYYVSAPPVESYSDVIFDTSSIPYAVIVTRDSASIRALVNNTFVSVNSFPLGWHPSIKTSNFGMAFGPNNDLIAVYSQGTTYALSFQPGLPPAAPQVVSPIHYCQGDSALSLTATGQNLTWGGNTVAPIPPTTTADTITYTVYSNSGIYSTPNTITVIIHPKPIINASAYTACSGDTIYLSTPAVQGANYHWVSMQVINGTSVLNSFDSTNNIPVLDSGYYTVTVTPEGCTSDTAFISVPDVLTPSISLTVPYTAVPLGQTVTVIATINNTPYGYVIDWYVNGSLYTAIPTDTFYYTKQAGTDSIVAVVRFPINYPCYTPDTSNVIVIDEDVTNAKDLMIHTKIVAYPNPFKQYIMLQGLSKGYRLRIYDMMGRAVATQEIQSETFQWNLNHLKTGFYLLNITDNKGDLKANISIEKVHDKD